MPTFLAALGTKVFLTASKLSEVVTAEMLGGVLDEVTALLPVTIPVAIGFIGLRKGISFVMGVLHAA